MRPKALGKGLSSLIPANGADKTSQFEKNENYFLCEIGKLVPNRDQPRKIFDKNALKELADSVVQNGIIQPLIVKKIEGGKYELIAGERRWRAAQMAGLGEVPVVVIERSEEKDLELALVENIQREDLNPIEEALAYKQLIDRYHYTQEECAKRVGKDRSTIANLIRLLHLPEEVRRFIVESKLSMGHARALLGLDSDADLVRVAKLVVEQGWSVRQVEEAVRKSKEEVVKTQALRKKLNPQLSHLQDEMMRYWGSRVVIQSKGKKGKIIIEYGSQDDLDRIVNLMKH